MICPKCGCRLLLTDGAYCQACMSVVDTRIQRGRGEQMPAGGGTSAPNPPCTPPSPCEMCNGVGFYVSLPGDTISPCPGCSEKHSTRLTAGAVDSGSKDSAPVDGDGEQS